MQSQLLAQLLFSKMGSKVNLPNAPVPSLVPANTTTNNNNNPNTNNSNIVNNNNDNNKESVEKNKQGSDSQISLSEKELTQSKVVHEKQDEISRLFERQEEKYLQLLAQVEKRMDEKLSKLTQQIEHRFNEIERRLSNMHNNNSNINEGSNVGDNAS